MRTCVCTCVHVVVAKRYAGAEERLNSRGCLHDLLNRLSLISVARANTGASKPAPTLYLPSISSTVPVFYGFADSNEGMRERESEKGD